MAAKKSATKKKATSTGTTAKVSSRGSATKKAVAPKAAKSPAAETSTKTKPAAETSTKTKPAASKTAAKKPLKLSEAQEKFLVQIDSGGDSGSTPANKTELRSMEKLREMKLVKKGAKDKATGNVPYIITAAGKKHLASKS